jgi:alkylation response protein AidB-like acyl-CoA dehydrogenase
MVASGWSLERELPTELTVTEAEFLERSRTWLAAEREMSYLDGLAARSPGEFFGIEPRFSRRLGEAGLLAVTTPAAVGGAGRSHLEQALLAAELAWQRLPVLGHFVAEREVIPALLRHGTAAQQERWLPELLAGEALCAQAFTEPDTGSDLVSISTRAERDGNGWVLKGEKWLNSVAHVARHLWTIVRTGGPGHRGLSMFLVPADAHGVRIERLREMTGIERMNRIVFDSVRLGPEHLVGPLDGGWAISMDTVARERPGAARPAGVRRTLAELAAYVPAGGSAPLGEDPAVAPRLAELDIRLAACEMLQYAYARDLDAGRADPDVAGITLKVYADRIEAELADLGTSLLGVEGLLDAEPEAPLAGILARGHLAAPGLSLGGGTTEILLNVLATRGLGLPRAKDRG